MTTLNLFPARIAFVNPDGTLTTEAYRALQVLFGRVGGALGDNGTDVFNNQVVMGQAADNPAVTDMLLQMAQPDTLLPDLMQATTQDTLLPDLMQTGGVMRPIASGGAKFLQLQEDGLPVLEFGDITFGNADIFLRADLNLSSVEAIRGGSASTFSSNSPGGVLNLISKTGEQEGGALQFGAGLDYQ